MGLCRDQGLGCYYNDNVQGNGNYYVIVGYIQILMLASPSLPESESEKGPQLLQGPSLSHLQRYIQKPDFKPSPVLIVPPKANRIWIWVCQNKIPIYLILYLRVTIIRAGKPFVLRRPIRDEYLIVHQGYLALLGQLISGPGTELFSKKCSHVPQSL